MHDPRCVVRGLYYRVRLSYIYIYIASFPSLVPLRYATDKAKEEEARVAEKKRLEDEARIAKAKAGKAALMARVANFHVDDAAEA